VTAIVSTIILLIPFLKIWPKFFEEVISFNLFYASAFPNPLGNFFSYLLKFLQYWWILLFLLIPLFFKKTKNILPYCALLIISLLTVFSSPIGHYYLLLMPFLALFFGALFASGLELLKNDRQKILAISFVLPIIILFMIGPFQEQFSLSPPELSTWIYGTANPFNESKIVGSHLAQITNPNDFVFVAGSEPQIYYYAQRKSATRFVITYPLNIPTPYREQYQREIIAELEKNPPQAIVVSERALSDLWNENSPQFFIKYLNNLLAKNYKIMGGYVWDNNEVGHWQEILDLPSMQNASLILFKKNN
jgi:hypothetical protein